MSPTPHTTSRSPFSVLFLFALFVFVLVLCALCFFICGCGCGLWSAVELVTSSGLWPPAAFPLYLLSALALA
jgi:hypothetical protein